MNTDKICFEPHKQQTNNINSSDARDGIFRRVWSTVMPWLLKPPGHQQAWYSQYRIGNSVLHCEFGLLLLNKIQDMIRTVKTSLIRTCAMRQESPTKTYTFDDLAGSLFTILCLFYLSLRTIWPERPQNSVVILYNFQCIMEKIECNYDCYYDACILQGKSSVVCSGYGSDILCGISKGKLPLNFYAKHLTDSWKYAINSLRRNSYWI